MQLKINEVAIPERIEWNFAELKNELAEKVELYSTVVYTDDQIKSAKADRASLNKLKSALNEERIRRKKEYMKPFDEFEAQIAEVISIIDKPIAVIDKQIKEVDEKRKARKLEEIGSIFLSMEHPDWLSLPRIFNEKWLNATYSISNIGSEIEATIAKIKTDINTLESLTEFNVEAIEMYKTSLDLGAAIAEGKRLAEIAKKRKEYEEQKILDTGKEVAKGFSEGVKEDFMHHPVSDNETESGATCEGQWITFSAFLSVPQALELKAFFNERNIEFRAEVR